MTKIFDRLLGETQKVLSLPITKTATPLLALKQWKQALKKSNTQNGEIIITAFRNQTWIEWAVYASFVFLEKGYTPTILYKGKEIKKINNQPYFERFWKETRSLKYFNFIDIESLDYNQSDYEHYLDFAYTPSVAALAYDYHIESQDILDHPDRYGKEQKQLQEETAKNGARLKAYFKENKFHRFICYSGIISDSSGALQGALDAHQETVCIEGWAWRKGHMIYNYNSPALEYNVQGWMKHFGEWNEEKNKQMSQYFSFLDNNSQDDDWLENFYNVQLAQVSETLPEYIKTFIEGDEKVFLLACNVIGDSSLLNRETIFNSHRAFVKETIEFFAKNPDLKLIIRAHPAEQWVSGKVKIKMGEYAKECSTNYSNVLVIDSDEKINTFSLIPFIEAGLVWLSSVGVDLVVRGVPVIAAAKPKYTQMGIVSEPDSKQKYFEEIELLAKKRIIPDNHQILKSKEYLYVVFKGFSFQAQGLNYRATNLKLGGMPNQEDHDKFFDILVGKIPAPDMI